MSLDISLTNKKTGESVADMNWLRNPYGLCNWAESNVNPQTKVDLWYVCNHWSYDDSPKVDRKLFKKVVDAYWAEIRLLQRGFFVFDLSSYIQFVQPNYELFPLKNMFGTDRINDAEFDDKGRIKIPMEYFGHQAFALSNPNLDGYKTWFSDLVMFAELLQDKGNEFYCSN